MLRRLLVVVGVILVVAVVGVSFLGVAQIPILSSVFGMDHARALGVQPDRFEFEVFCDRYGITRPSAPENYTLSSKHHWSGSVQIDATLSQEALASLHEFRNSNAHFKDVQFRIHDGYVEMAAFVTNVQGYPISGPVYGQFSITKTSSKSVHVDFSKLEFGRIGVPDNIVDHAQNTIDGYLDKTIVEAGISIDAVELREGEIYFKGTWPTTITADPPNSNDLP
jgi:hypothetical protein